MTWYEQGPQARLATMTTSPTTIECSHNCWVKRRYEDPLFSEVAFISHVGICGRIINFVCGLKKINFVSHVGHQIVGLGNPSSTVISITQIRGGVSVEKHESLIKVIKPCVKVGVDESIVRL